MKDRNQFKISMLWIKIARLRNWGQLSMSNVNIAGFTRGVWKAVMQQCLSSCFPRAEPI